MRKTPASKRRKNVSSTSEENSEDDSEESPEETEDDEQLQSKLPAAPTTRKLHSLTEVVERIKKNASSRSMQGSDRSKAASAPPAMNVTRTIEGVARSTSAHQPVTITQQSSIARDASHSTSPSSSHDTPQVNNNDNNTRKEEETAVFAFS